MKYLVTAMFVFAAGCGSVPTNPIDRTEQSSDVTCSQIDDQTYTSVEDHRLGRQCGNDASGVYMCTDYDGSWSVSFYGDDHTFFWSQGYNGDSGTYTCSKAGLSMNGGSGNADIIENVVRGTTLYLNYKRCPNDRECDNAPLESRSHQYQLESSF